MAAEHTSQELEQRQPQQSTQPSVMLTNQQLRYIASTDFVPKQLRGNLPAILACVAFGRALGIPDMVALRQINVIDGRPSFAAELMVARVRERGHSITGNFAADSCTVIGKRADNGDEISVTWTTEMAREAGLLGKDNWKKYKPAMLWARAVSQLCRMLFADCFGGIGTYTEEEVEMTDLERDEEHVNNALGDLHMPANDAAPDDALDGDAAELVDEGQGSFEDLVPESVKQERSKKS